MHAGPAAAPWHEEGADIDDRPAAGLERPLGIGVRRAIAPGVPVGRIEPIVAGTEVELDEYASQRPQQPQQGCLELEERRGPPLIQTRGDDLLELCAGLLLQRIDGRWTRYDGRITLKIAHGGRLRTVPVWEMFSGQDKSPEPQISAPTANNGPPCASANLAESRGQVL